MAVSKKTVDRRSERSQDKTEWVTLEMGGRALSLYRIKECAKNSSPYWQCKCYMDGKSRQTSTKQENLTQAKEAAIQWYAGLLLKIEQGLPLKSNPKSFDSIAETFFKRCDRLAEQGKRHKNFSKDKRNRYKNYLLPFLGDDLVHTINTPRINAWLKWREDKRVKSSQLLTAEIKKEMQVLRGILNEAVSEGLLENLPMLPPSLRVETMSVKSSTTRIYFSFEELSKLFEGAKRRAQEAKNLSLNPPKQGGNWKKIYHDRLYLYYYLLWLAYTGMRPEEAQRVRLKDVHLHIDKPKEEKSGILTLSAIDIQIRIPKPYEHQYLTIDIKGKKSDRKVYAKQALVPVFESLRKSVVGQFLKPEDRIFHTAPRVGLNSLLADLNLKTDNMGRNRDAKSLRHYYIMQALADETDVYQLGQHCDVSPDVIRKHYAKHMPSKQFKAQLIKDAVNDLL